MLTFTSPRALQLPMRQVPGLPADPSAPSMQQALCVSHSRIARLIKGWRGRAQADPAQAAADAADAAIGGGPEGPAAAAARRAAAAGQAASRRGFAGVGGAAAHMAALRELVTLPLQARLLPLAFCLGCLRLLGAVSYARLMAASWLGFDGTEGAARHLVGLRVLAAALSGHPALCMCSENWGPKGRPQAASTPILPLRHSFHGAEQYF